MRVLGIIRTLTRFAIPKPSRPRPVDRQPMGAMGLIELQDGRLIVYRNSQFLNDGSRPRLEADCTLDVDQGYARDVSTTNLTPG